jgi:bifunctional pyridoxal-dependent enzyme with beta-cystathionase and maltose regulon repressor activities
MTEVCLNEGKSYRAKKNKYITANFELFKELTKEKLPKL